MFNCLFIVRKHLAQTCGSITLDDSQTFYQMSDFNGKSHNLQTRKYDVSMTSPAAKNIQLFYQWCTCFLSNIPWKFCWKLNIFHGNIQENVMGVFFWTQWVTWLLLTAYISPYPTVPSTIPYDKRFSHNTCVTVKQTDDTAYQKLDLTVGQKWYILILFVIIPCPSKNVLLIFLNNSVQHWSILIIFGIQHREETWRKGLNHLTLILSLHYLVKWLNRSA